MSESQPPKRRLRAALARETSPVANQRSHRVLVTPEEARLAPEPDEIARAWETAQAWRELDADARRAAERIHEELRSRYGIDADEIRADRAAVRAALAAHDTREGAAGERRSSARGGGRSDRPAGRRQSRGRRPGRPR